MPKDWRWLDEIAGKLDREVLEAAAEEPGQRKRPALDEFHAKRKQGKSRGRAEQRSAFRHKPMS